MRSLLKLAWRNLWRNRRRTLINLSASGFGLFLIVVYSGLLAGVVGDASTQLDNTGMGHVELTAPGWRARHGAAQALSDPEALLAGLQLPEGTQRSGRVVARGLASSARGSQGVVVHGIDPVTEALVATYVTDVREGERLAAGDLRGALVGEKLAERLKLKVGQKLRLMVQRADGEMGADVFRVRGFFHSLSPNISRSTVLLTAPAARTLLGVGEVAHQVVLQLPEAGVADEVAATLRSRLGASVEVASYGELMPVLRKMEELVDGVSLIVALFVYLLVGLGILNTTLMSVLERTREFGVMRALGSRSGQVVRLVLAESFWVATLASVIGLTLGLTLTYVGSERPLVDFGKSVGESFEMAGTVMRSAFRTEFSLGSAARSAGIVYLTTLLVGLYPAWRVNRLSPSEALRTH